MICTGILTRSLGGVGKEEGKGGRRPVGGPLKQTLIRSKRGQKIEGGLCAGKVKGLPQLRGGNEEGDRGEIKKPRPSTTGKGFKPRKED